jgi:hypothetical protein
MGSKSVTGWLPIKPKTNLKKYIKVEGDRGFVPAPRRIEPLRVFPINDLTGHVATPRAHLDYL